MWSDKWHTEGTSHFLGPAGSSLVNAAQDVIGLCCCEDTLLAYAQLGVHQDPHFLQSCSWRDPIPCCFSGGFPSQVQDLAFVSIELLLSFVKFLSALMCSLSSPSVALCLRITVSPTYSVLITNLLRVHSILLCKSLIKTLSIIGHIIDPWRMPWVTRHKLGSGMADHSLCSLTVQPQFHLIHSSLIQTMSFQFSLTILNDLLKSRYP